MSEHAASQALRRRHERRARFAVSAGLAAAVGLTVAALMTAHGPVPAVTAQPGGASATVGGAGFPPAAAPAPNR